MAVTKLKKRHGSMKTKKGWRKADIQDVEDFLEDKRLEERLGAPFKDRKDGDLFTVDTTPEVKNFEHFEELKKERRKEILSKPPRCFQILQSDSKVPDPVVKRNRVRTAEERKHPLLLRKEQERARKGILKAKELNQVRSRRANYQRRKTKPVPGDFGKNLWDPENAVAPELNSQWIEPTTKQYILENIDSLKIKSLKTKENSKPHLTPVIEPPHPGISYNPSFEEHLDLLEKIAEKEKGLVKEEQHIKRVTSSMFRKVSPQEVEAQWMKEMSQGVPTIDPEAAKPDEPTSDNEYHAINPPIDRLKKKDRIKRRNMRLDKLMKAAVRKSKIEQKKISDLHRVKKFDEELSLKEEQARKLQKKRKAKEAVKALQTKRLGRNKFEEREMDFKLPSDLEGSLRSLKPEGNLLADRFTSLQKRNIMEVTKVQMRHPPKRKQFVKASHKVDWDVHPLNPQTRKQGHIVKKKKKHNTTLGLK